MTAVPGTPEYIYKIATREAYATSRDGGVFTGMPIDVADGYIHFSTAAQLAETLALHFRGQRDLVLMAVPTATFATGLAWEPSRGGELFPHLYAPLPMSVLAWAEPIEVAPDGGCALPPGVR